MNLTNIKYRIADTLRRWGIKRNYRRTSHPLIEEYLNGTVEDVKFSKGLEWGDEGVNTIHPKQPWQYWTKESANLEAPLRLNAEYEEGIYNLDVYMSNVLYSSPCYIETDVWISEARHIHYAPHWSWGNTVPPEVDCAEVYSDEKGNNSVQSNIHHGQGYAHDGKPNASIKGRKHAYFWGEYNRYGVLYEKDQITFFINRHPVRNVKKKDLQRWSDRWNVISGAGMKKESLSTKENVHGILREAKVYRKL